ncbi:hypothetical protein HPB50_012198 [Hyalomma asiaticum]|uniref:Uncharacterized protein n=1 Tax=Hyalomma asiaticum TaxID=266040 RepID=A0ACB7T5Z0_HYAAI|nr:hypothetical protein HPB50_012198 [Hyalomma asiaticum]
MLKLTKPGRDILRRLGYHVEGDEKAKKHVSLQLRNYINVAALPRNMHPEHHKGRRIARVKALSKAYGSDEGVRYADAAKYRGMEAHAVSVTNGRGEELAAASDTNEARCLPRYTDGQDLG